MGVLKGIILGASVDTADVAHTLTGRSSLALPIANRPIAAYGLQALAECGVREVAALLPPSELDDAQALAGEAARLDITLSTIAVEGGSGPVAALLAARDFLSDHAALVHAADGLIARPIAAAIGSFLHEDADAGLLVAAEESSERGDGGALRLVSHPRIPAHDATLAPALLLGPAALGHAAAAAAAGRPPGTLVELALALQEGGGRVTVRGTGAGWRYSDDIDHLLEGNRMVLDELVRDVRGADISQARVEGRVAIHRSAVVERTTIRGPAVIGPGVVLVDAFVGPYSSIGDNAHVEGSEVEHSIVLAGAAIRHVGRRLEASVVGRDANVHRDFQLPAALRVRVGRRAEVSLA